LPGFFDRGVHVRAAKKGQADTGNRLLIDGSDHGYHHPGSPPCSQRSSVTVGIS
jgi:hypothetical protein